MNKKFLFAAMSLAALTACSTDDFESQQQVAEGVSPIKFEVINNSETTRASMNESEHKIVWSAADGDLFTLYHGGTPVGSTIGFENATYTATAGANGAPATLSTPSMIKDGGAIMVWPVDTTFRITNSDAISIAIPAEQTSVANQIPYVSDLVTIAAHAGAGTYNTAGTGKYNEAGYNRSYPIFMRPMASQLIVKADYNKTDATIAELYDGGKDGLTGDDAIGEIKVTSIDLEAQTEKFTTEIPLTFTAITTGDATDKRWDAASKNNAWSHITGFGTATASVNKLTAKDDCVEDDNSGCTFLILPQANITSADGTSAVVVNTNYGKVLVAKQSGVPASKYSDDEIQDAWYRYVSSTTAAAAGETKATKAETAGDNKGKYKTTANIADGMKQTLNVFSAFTAPAKTPVVEGEPMGTWTTRYVKVLLNHLDMTDLHIKSDKQLSDVVRVWKKIGHATVTVALDGDSKKNEFEISQKTIKLINEINAAAAKESPKRSFSVKPCTVSGEACSTIVITGGGEIAADLTFIKDNSGTKAAVALKAGESWEWAASKTAEKRVTVDASTGISSFINRGTLTSKATATLTVYNNASTPAQVNMPFVNDGTWDVTAGDLTVQFDVTNNGTVNIKKGAEYHQDITAGTTATTFENDAQTLEKRFDLNDPSISQKAKDAFVEKIGVVNNSGVFAVTGNTTAKGVINNYSLIEHADKDAKTYITANAFAGSSYATAWGAANKLGRINLPFSNKDEDNISINAALATGFVSVTVSTGDGAPANGNLNAAVVGDKVNYVIINSGVTAITEMSNKIKYIEFNDDNKAEIAWQAGTSAEPKTATYEGLIVLSPVNIKLYTTVNVNQSTYLAAKMYVGGGFTPGTGNYSGYYGNTTANKTSMYITY